MCNQSSNDFRIVAVIAGTIAFIVLAVASCEMSDNYNQSIVTQTMIEKGYDPIQIRCFQARQPDNISSCRKDTK